MTEAEFVDWTPEDRTIRYEWVDGKVEPLAAVSLRHDEIQDWLRNFVHFFVRARKLGKVFGITSSRALTQSIAACPTWLT